MELSAKVKKSLNIGLRALVALLAFWFIYRQVFTTGDFANFSRDLSQKLTYPSFRLLIIIAFILMPLNWGIEALKWKMLINYIEKISYFNAFRSVLTGISMSLFTPNRVGEFFGRVFTLKLNDPFKGVLLTIAGSISQLITTLLFGLISSLFYIKQYIRLTQTWQWFLYAGIVIFALVIGVLLVMLFLRAPVLSARVHSLIRPGWHKIHEYIAVLQSVRRNTLLKVLLLSLSRYVVFSGQFYILLRAFNLEIPVFNAFVLISMTYFVMTAIPTVALVDVGIRGSVAIYFISMYFPGSALVATSILSATTLIWIINLALPALFGLLFINRLTILRKSRLHGN
ncbi:MAG: flippase-like domain-containing protein [Bacteroidales bacterium]|nr:flippase-like domain-containing protein [Bacteroidales bacterium]